MKIEPKLAYYIEEFNNAGRDFAVAVNKMQKYRKFAKDDFGIDIACDGRVQ